MTGVVFGGILPQSEKIQQIGNHLQIERRGKWLLYFAIAIFVITLPISYRSAISNGGNISSFYVKSYEQASDAYGSIHVFGAVDYLQALAGYLVIVLTPTYGYRNGKWGLPLVGIACVIGRTLLSGGRVAVFDLIFVVGMMGLLSRNQQIPRRLGGRYYLNLVVLVVGVWSVAYVTDIRMETNSIQDELKEFVIYQSVGFLMLHEEFNDKHSMLNESGFWYGLASTTGVQSILEIGVRRLKPDFVGPGDRLVDYIGRPRDIGNDIRENAYYTVFYPLYLDGGIIAVFIGGVSFGFLINRWYVKMLKINSYLHWVLVGTGLFTGFESLLFPPIIRIQYIFLWICIYALTFNWLRHEDLSSVLVKRKP
jgi:oligosaccharide repeat unit polymerase